jgi:hypothetical protein
MAAAISPEAPPAEATAAETTTAEMSSPETPATKFASFALSGKAQCEQGDGDATGRDCGKCPDHSPPPQTGWMQR